MVKPRVYKVTNRATMVGRFVEVSPGDLSPAARRTRKHPNQKRRTLLESIRTQGIISPIIVNAANVIVDGHLRADIAIQLNLRTVPVVRVEHLTEAELRAFGIAANRMPATVEWDLDELRLELEEIRADDPMLDLTLTGFSVGEQDRIGGNHLVSKYDDLDEPDVSPPSEPPSAQIGNRYRLGEHEVVCGDATNPKIIESLMHGEEAQAAFTDPPYNVKINGHVSSSGQHTEFAMASGEMSSPQFTDFLETGLGNMANAMANGGIAFVCMDHAHIGELLDAGAKVFARRLNICVWDKGQGGMGALYRSRHELVVVFKKGDAPHRNNIALGKNGRDRTNVWSFPGMAGFSATRKKALELHPTMKPVALIAEALLDVTAPGDIVLDAFGGPVAR